MTISLSVILPCYNEGATLNELIDQYCDAFKGRAECEIVLVDNGSNDDSWPIIQDLMSRETTPQISAVRISENRGYGYGIVKGLSAASGRFLAWSHADMQCSATDVLRLFEEINKAKDPTLCFGKGHRVSDRGKSAIPTRIQSFLARLLLRYPMVEINAQPKLFHRSFFETWCSPPDGYELDIYAYFLALRRDMKVVSIDVDFADRLQGKSKWSYSWTSRLRFMVRNTFYLIRLRRAN